jgi:hypothetical protein
VTTPASRAKRGRQQFLTPLSAAGDDSALDDDDLTDLDATDQGLLLQEAADTALPGDDSPSQMHASKRARFPSAPDGCPLSAAKAAAAARRLRNEMGGLSLIAASMVLVAAVLMAGLLPQLAPQRAALQANVQRSLQHTHAAVWQPLQAGVRARVASAGRGLGAGQARAAALIAHGAAQGRAHLQTSRRVIAAQWAACQRAAAQQVAASRQFAGRQWAGLQAKVASLDLPQVPVTLQAWAADAMASASAAAARVRGAPAPWSPRVLAAVLPAGSQWGELAADISEALAKPPAARNHKAPALLLGCASADDCAGAATALSALPPKGAECTLLVDSAQLGGAEAEGSAALQAALAPFLRRCPAGLVVLRAVQRLPLAAVPALNNALSELGGFQHDGHVDGSGAAYALLMTVPEAQLAQAAGAADTDVAQHAVKEALFAGLRAQLQAQIQATKAAARQAAEAQGSTDEEQLQQQASAAAEARWGAISRGLTALHRRVEFAAPLRPAAAAA